MPVPSEKLIVRRILDYLNSLEGCRARKAHGGPHSQAGEPDIDAVLRGRAIKLEVKRPGGKPTPLQQRRLDQWAEAGAIVGVVTGATEVEELLAAEGLLEE